MILQRNGSSQGQTTHSGAEQHHPPRRLPPTHQHQWSIPQMRECSGRRPPSKGGVRTNTSPTFPSATKPRSKKGCRIQRRLECLEWLCFDDKCNRLDALSCSSTSVNLFTRVQVSCAEIFPIVLPFDARQFSRRHQGKTCLFNLRNVMSMWPLPPSDVT